MAPCRKLAWMQTKERVFIKKLSCLLWSPLVEHFVQQVPPLDVILPELRNRNITGFVMWRPSTITSYNTYFITGNPWISKPSEIFEWRPCSNSLRLVNCQHFVCSLRNHMAAEIWYNRHTDRTHHWSQCSQHNSMGADCCCTIHSGEALKRQKTLQKVSELQISAHMNEIIHMCCFIPTVPRWVQRLMMQFSTM